MKTGICIEGASSWKQHFQQRPSDAVSPDRAVIQAGNNFFGHPAPQTLERLEARNISIYRNDLHGAVIMNYKDEGWSIHVMNNND